MTKEDCFVSNMKNVLEIEKKNAVKEFAEKIKAHAERCYDWDIAKIVNAEVDNVLKEYEK